MIRKELTLRLARDASGIEQFIYDADKDDLRRLVLELDCALNNAARKLAYQSGLDSDEVKLGVYGDLASALTEAWTYGTGEWDDDDIECLDLLDEDDNEEDD